MKNTTLLTLLGLALLLGGLIWQSLQVSRLQEQVLEMNGKAAAPSEKEATAAVASPKENEPKENEPKENEHYELAKAMGYMQRFAEKIYWAGKEKNWELAAFYVHEAEETAEEIIAHKPIKNEKEIAPLVAQMFIPALEGLEEGIKAQDALLFGQKYQTLIQTCNACHAASGYGIIKLQVPTQNSFPSQVFAP
ncbi:hypothetical protein [Hugenholtzia roseola]|uniref:hypothetical protein n=1 Tax=Hugenholtzia roseola TaxID=1002 RepID=UPI0003FDA60E|nr:hypothetical protein [Hugenholtzia roseola]